MKRLTEEQIARYRRDGFLDAQPVLTPDEVRTYRSELESYEQSIGHSLAFPEKTKPYLLFEWADAIVHNPILLDYLEDLIGPDILVYHTTLWTKEPGAETFVVWHQDDAYFHLDPPEQITAWVALSEANEVSGCMRMVPGSHEHGYIEHTDNPHERNIIRRGQGIHGKYGPDDGVLVPVPAGSASFHNTHTAHASSPNRGNDRRIGLGISYIPAHVRPKTQPYSSTLRVRGVDRHRNFHAEARLNPAMPMAQRRELHTKANTVYLAAARIPEGG